MITHITKESTARRTAFIVSVVVALSSLAVPVVAADNAGLPEHSGMQRPSESALPVAQVGAVPAESRGVPIHALPEFDYLEVGDGLKLRLHQFPLSRSDCGFCTFRPMIASVNLDQVEVSVTDGTLYLNQAKWVKAAPNPPVIDLYVWSIAEIVTTADVSLSLDYWEQDSLVIDAANESVLNARGLRVDDLVVIGRDAAQIRLSGVAQTQYAELTGAGRLDAQKLHVQFSQIALDGQYNAQLWVDALLDFSVRGDAELSFIGGPVLRTNESTYMRTTDLSSGQQNIRSRL